MVGQDLGFRTIDRYLAVGTYAVDLLGGQDRDGSVMAFVRLTKRR